MAKRFSKNKIIKSKEAFLNRRVAADFQRVVEVFLRKNSNGHFTGSVDENFANTMTHLQN